MIFLVEHASAIASNINNILAIGSESYKGMENNMQAIFKNSQKRDKSTTSKRKERVKTSVSDTFKLSWSARFVSFILELGFVAASIPMVLILVTIMFKCLKFVLKLELKP